MKTKNDIITEMYIDGTVKKMINKLSKDTKNPIDFLDDLEQEIYLILLEKPDDLIIDLYNKQELGYYTLKIVSNQLISNTSPYYIKYIKPGVYETEEITEQTQSSITTEDIG